MKSIGKFIEGSLMLLGVVFVLVIFFSSVFYFTDPLGVFSTSYTSKDIRYEADEEITTIHTETQKNKIHSTIANVISSISPTEKLSDTEIETENNDSTRDEQDNELSEPDESTPNKETHSKTSAQTTENVEFDHPLLSDSQEKLVERFGYDVSQIPTEISPEVQACAVEKLGAERVADILNGNNPTIRDWLKVKNCTELQIN
jgi:hypothetical protein